MTTETTKEQRKDRAKALTKRVDDHRVKRRVREALESHVSGGSPSDAVSLNRAVLDAETEQLHEDMEQAGLGPGSHDPMRVLVLRLERLSRIVGAGVDAQNAAMRERAREMTEGAEQRIAQARTDAMDMIAEAFDREARRVATEVSWALRHHLNWKLAVLVGALSVGCVLAGYVLGLWQGGALAWGWLW